MSNAEEGIDADLCVVGGGAAGASAASLATAFGLRTHAFESGQWLQGLIPGPDVARTSTRARGPASYSPLSEQASEAAAFALQSFMTRDGLRSWRQRFVSSGMTLHPETEVVGIEPGGAGTWIVVAKDPESGRRMRVTTRAVLIATGESTSQPSDEASSRLAFEIDAVLGRPALVIGETPEAVSNIIAISNAKARANDTSGIYWVTGRDPAAAPSIDGLGDAFLRASIDNRNIHPLANCEILGEIAGPRGEERFGVRLDRKQIPGRPDEVLLYEFERDCVSSFLDVEASKRLDEPDCEATKPAFFGLALRIGERNGHGVLRVDERGETSLPGIFVAGDALGRWLIEGPHDAENPDPSERVGGLARVLHEAARSVDAIAAALGSGVGGPLQRPQTTIVDGGWILCSLRSDGSIDSTYPVEKPLIEIGQDAADIALPNDSHLAPHHASLVDEEGELYVVDSGHGSGVWLRIDSREGWELEDDDQVWVGAQILVAAKQPAGWQLVHYGADARARGSYDIPPDGLLIGRKTECRLDAHDAMLSRRHAQFIAREGRLRVYDRGARNGTYVKIRSAAPLSEGDEFRIATQCFRLARQGGAPPPTPGVEVHFAGGEVRFDDDQHPARFHVGPDKTILQGFIESGGEQAAPLSWECQTGDCGLCTIEVVSGAEMLSPVADGSGELEIIRATEGVESASRCHRLACLTRLRGPAVLRRVRRNDTR